MRNIFSLAIELEKEGLITYLRFAYQIENLAAKNLFIRLAMDEFEHLKILEEELAHFKKEAKLKRIRLPKTEIEKTTANLKPILPQEKKEVDINELNALQVALNLEKRAIDFYGEQEKKSKDEIAQKMWKRLREIEESHYQLIQAEIDTLTKTGFWFDFREFSLEME
jgi:rubrerythrin